MRHQDAAGNIQDVAVLLERIDKDIEDKAPPPSASKIYEKNWSAANSGPSMR